MNLRFSSLKQEIKLVSLVLFIKMVFVPLLLLFILAFIGTNLDLPWKVGILEIAMPPMVLASIFVINANLAKDLAVSSVGAGILLSFITIPLIYYLISS